jgi:hypothetical protein
VAPVVGCWLVPSAAGELVQPLSNRNSPIRRVQFVTSLTLDCGLVLS